MLTLAALSTIAVGALWLALALICICHAPPDVI